MTDKEELIKAAETLGNYCSQMTDCYKCYLYNFCLSIAFHDNGLGEAFKDFKGSLE